MSKPGRRIGAWLAAFLLYCAIIAAVATWSTIDTMPVARSFASAAPSAVRPVLDDYNLFAFCMAGPYGGTFWKFIVWADGAKGYYGYWPMDQTPLCKPCDYDADRDVDLEDLSRFLNDRKDSRANGT